MLTKKQEEKASKYLSFILRHSPQSANLILDPEGFTGASNVLYALKQAGYEMTFMDLCTLVSNDKKQRYSFDWSNQNIRANQGHSVTGVELGLDEFVPPIILYHGTSKKAYKEIVVTGISRMSRTHVHLTEHVSEAIEVGKRHTKGIAEDVVVLSVHAQEMSDEGHKFYVSQNKVWLVEHVPGEFVYRFTDHQ